MSFSRTSSRSPLLLAGLGLILALTGCGSSSGSTPEKPAANAFTALTGSKIVAAAASDMKKTGATHLNGTMIVDGAKLRIDAKSDGKGGCAGEFGSKGATATFISTSDATYLKANDAFWEQNTGGKAAAAQTIKFLDGRWAKLPASDKFGALCGLGQQLFDSAEGSGPVGYKKGDVSRLHGHPVIELSTSTGKEKYRMYVRTDEPHQLLKIASDTVGDEGEMTFDFDEKITTTVPPAAETVSLS